MKKIAFYFLTFSSCLLLSLAAPTDAQAKQTAFNKTNTAIHKTNSIKTKASQFLAQQVKQTKAPSLSVAAAHKGKLLFALAEGVANKTSDQKATVNTQYRTGSVSKVIATTAFMPLIEQNKVNLNDTITSYLSYLPSHYNTITLKHLFTHTSGIRHYRFGEYGTNTEYPTIEKASEVFRDSALTFQPGTDYTYSTYGINLIQGVIEKVSSKPLAQYLQQSLFTPFNMPNTELEIQGRATKQYAIGYRSYLTDRPVKDINVSNKYIGGGMRTTPTDLINMVSAINQNRLFSAKTKALMLDIPFPKAAPDRALGWRWLSHKGSKAFAHSGGINGFESFLVHFVKEDITVAVMVNQDDYDYTGSTLWALFDLVKKEVASKALM